MSLTTLSGPIKTPISTHVTHLYKLKLLLSQEYLMDCTNYKCSFITST